MGSRARGFALPPQLLGLRPRLLAAMLLSSVVTLAVAALALLSPLEQRLREDGEATVKAALGASRPELAEIRIDPATGLPSEGEVRVAVDALRRRSDGEVAILDSALDVLYATPSTSLNVPDYYGQVRLALRTHTPVHTLVGDELVVAEPLKIAGQRYVVALTRRLDYVASAVRVVRTAFLEAAAAGLLVALLLGIGIATTLLRRLERLRDATRELERHGGGGFGSDPLPEDRGLDEIGELTRAFRRMQSRLRGQEAARQAFVATASHELRTPLASLDGMLELLEDDLDPAQLDLDDARDRISSAREQTRTLTHLASDLLDLSRLDADVELRSEPLELGELCRAVAAERELDAGRHHVAILAPPPPEPCWAQGDPGAVARIVRILLDNALRVAPPDSSIELQSALNGPYASLTVSDRGPGVAPSERSLIFERFQRGSSTGGRSGFGLGLAIGRELAVRMGGALELLDAGGPGPTHPGGARFQLRLPGATSLGEERHP
jgi:signal transduction histidine kinase